MQLALRQRAAALADGVHHVEDLGLAAGRGQGLDVFQLHRPREVDVGQQLGDFVAQRAWIVFHLGQRLGRFQADLALLGPGPRAYPAHQRLTLGQIKELHLGPGGAGRGFEHHITRRYFAFLDEHQRG